MKKSFALQITNPPGVPYRPGELFTNATIWAHSSGVKQNNKVVPTYVYRDGDDVFVRIELETEVPDTRLSIEPFRFLTTSSKIRVPDIAKEV